LGINKELFQNFSFEKAAFKNSGFAGFKPEKPQKPPQS
jgi:hypothetical protein